MQWIVNWHAGSAFGGLETQTTRSNVPGKEGHMLQLHIMKFAREFNTFLVVERCQFVWYFT